MHRIINIFTGLTIVALVSTVEASDDVYPISFLVNSSNQIRTFQNQAPGLKKQAHPTVDTLPSLRMKLEELQQIKIKDEDYRIESLLFYQPMTKYNNSIKGNEKKFKTLGEYANSPEGQMIDLSFRKEEGNILLAYYAGFGQLRHIIVEAVLKPITD